MNRVADTSVEPRDDLDVLLGGFFKAEMPSPWPAFQAPAGARSLPLPTHRPAAPSRWLGSRFSLAASVAVLVSAGWMLGGRLATPDGVTLPPAEKGSANRNNRLPPGTSRPSPEGDHLPVTLEQRDRTGFKVDVLGSRTNP